mmetsp:Transcript_16939/g.29113  ORF Transcript_16939/g.29113 Transcript_16939/m.29113 type:complete len:374 (-) Transcript_16939:3152-4273(-)
MGEFRRWAIPCAFVVVSLAWVVQFIVRTREVVPGVDCGVFVNLCKGSIADGAPPEIGAGLEGTVGSSKFAYGRWKVPNDDSSALDMHGNVLDKFFKLKRWHYTSVSLGKYYVAVTPVQFNYIEDIYVSVVDKESKSLVFEYHYQFPFGRSLKVSPESTNGCTLHVGWASDRVEICFANAKWHMMINVAGFRAKIEIEKGAEALVLWYPLGASENRPAYVHKEAGMRASGWLEIGDGDKYTHDQGAATVDWTKTLALRETKWKWASVSTSDGHVKTVSSDGSTVKEETAYIGINFSGFVYDVTGKPASSENGIWINHKVYPINAVININEEGNIWTIVGQGSQLDVNLTFQPHGLREDHTGADFVGIVSDFVQP